jgi:hypothetical protein
MLSTVTAIRFEKAVDTGRTRPGIFTCEDGDGNETELVLKFSAGCDLRERALVTEVLAALLAADLDLPVPEPFVVRVDSDLAATIPDHAIRERAERSLGWNFGSKKLPPGFSTVPVERPVPNALMSVACEVLAFDTFIANPDRTVANPNCLSNGRGFAIIDHEAAFFTEGIIGWKPPWDAGGIHLPKGLPPRSRHLFLEALRGESVELERLAGAFDLLTPARLAEYRTALPPAWIEKTPATDGILEYIQELKDHVEPAIQNLKEALK